MILDWRTVILQVSECTYLMCIHGLTLCTYSKATFYALCVSNMVYMGSHGEVRSIKVELFCYKLVV